jgi:hypothetical protein
MYLAGNTISKGKCFLAPTTNLGMLGHGTDTVRQRFWVPDEKVTALAALIAAMKATHIATILEIQRVVGKAESLSLAVSPYRCSCGRHMMR